MLKRVEAPPSACLHAPKHVRILAETFVTGVAAEDVAGYGRNLAIAQEQRCGRAATAEADVD